MNEQFKISIGVDLNTKQAYTEIRRKLKIIQKKLDGVDVKLDTKKAEKGLDNLSNKSKKAKKDIDSYKKGTDKATKANKNFGQTLSDKVFKFGVWAAISAAVYGTINAIKDAISTVMDIETSMTNFKIVADATESQLEDVNMGVNELVGTLGALKTEVTDTATEFARAGFAIDESMIMAEQAIIGARTGFTSLSQVSETLIVTLRAFNLESTESKNIVNDLFVASKTAAVTFEELGQGLKRSANSMAIAGASFEETISLISAANETVQDASKVGSALKTVSSRLRAVDNASNLPKLSKQMRDFGVEIEDGAGGFRNIYDIMQDLTGAFEKSTDQFAKQAVLESLAGKRRANVLVGLINNWEKAEEVRTKALNSSEEATEAQQELLETSNGQIELMTGNWQVFADNVVNSKGIFKTLSFINKQLKEINESFDARAFSEKISGKKIGMTLTEQAYKDYQELLRTDEVKSAISQFKEDLKEIDKETADALLSQLASFSRARGEILSNIAMLNARLENEDLKGFDVGDVNTKIDKLGVALVELDKKTAKLGFENVASGIEMVKNKIQEITDEADNAGDKTFSEYEMLMNGHVDITDSATKEMLRDFEYYSDEKKRNIKEALNAIIESSVTELELAKSRVAAYDQEINAMKNKLQVATTWSEVTNAIHGMNAAMRAKNSDKEIQSIDAQIEYINRLKATYKDLDGTSDSASSSTKKLAEPLSDLEIQIRDLQHEIKLLDGELKRNEDNYSEQVRITNELINKKEQEKSKLEELAQSQKAEYESMKTGTAARQDAVAEYQKTVEAIGKVENEIYAYEESLISLAKTEREVLKEQTIENINKVRDRYTEHFDDLRDKYKRDSEEFEKAQDDKVRKIEQTIDKLRKKYDTEDFVDEEQEIQDRILEIEQERLMLSVDESLQADLRRTELAEQMELEQEALADLRRDRERDLEIQSLEDKKSRIEEETREYKENLEERMNELDKFEDKAMDKLDNFESSWSNFSGNLGQALEDGMLPSIHGISEELSNLLEGYEGIGDMDFSTGADVINTGGTTGGSSGGGGSSRPKDWDAVREANSQTPSIGKSRQEISDEYERKHGHRPDSGVIDAIQRTGGTFKDGGIVGKGNFTDTSFMDELSKMTDGSIPVMAHEGEWIVNQNQQNIIGKNMADSGNSYDNLINISNLNITASNGYDVEQVGIDLVKGARKEISKKGV